MSACAAFFMLLSTGLAAASPTPISQPRIFSSGHRDLVSQAAFQPSEWNKKVLAAIASQRQKLSDSMVIEREVFGYLPYWMMDDTEPPWDLLTTFAWFGVEMDETGQATQWHGWGGEVTEALVNQAIVHGVTPILTITNFDNDEIATLLSSPSYQAAAIETCLMLMAVHGAEGINIDFETVPLSVKPEFVTFMTDLKAAVLEAQPNGNDGHVSLAGPAVDWSGSYDYDQLLIHTDGIMVMAYMYYWSGSDPGPISPLFGGDKWGDHTVSWTIDDYMEWGGFENRHKVIIGLPFYGFQWPVADTTVPGVALGSGNSITMAAAEPEAAANGKQWDDESKTAYYHKEKDGKLWQVWYDDQASFGAKIAYVAEKDLGGVGIWALGYEGSNEDYWVELEEQWAVPVAEEEDAGSADEDAADALVADVEEGDDDAAGPVDDDAAGPVDDDVGFVDPDDVGTALSDVAEGDGDAGVSADDEPAEDSGFCTPQCNGKACGDDGCGGNCGSCVDGEVCDGAQCVNCLSDDGACCGDGACDDNENCATCADDCGACDGDNESNTSGSRGDDGAATDASTNAEGQASGSGGCQMAATDSEGLVFWLYVGVLFGLLATRRTRRHRARVFAV